MAKTWYVSSSVADDGQFWSVSSWASASLELDANLLFECLFLSARSDYLNVFFSDAFHIISSDTVCKINQCEWFPLVLNCISILTLK